MKYGCIGERLKHSFSKEIHNALADYEYELIEIEKDKLQSFAETKDFLAVNVTIPYKELIMPYLYYIDGSALEIGAVNTVVNRNGRLYGYNTDFYGMSMLISHMGIDVKGKKVLILGTGGTSKTSLAVAKALGAHEVIRVSRSAKEDAISYEDTYKNHTDASIIINTTPSGMFPSIFDTPIELSRFESLIGVIDAVYNPLRSTLILNALERGINAEGGLYMLVAQAVRASEIFTDKKYSRDKLDSVYKKILSEKQNIVLTGMPASGKSTVGQLLAKKLNRQFIDTDTLIEEKTKKSIPQIFKENGEAYFRDVEASVIRDLAGLTGLVIATGGGAILRSDNVSALKRNGKLYFIDRPLKALIPTSDRPLSSNKADIEKRYRERYELYTSTADVKINADCDAESVSNKISEDFLK